MPTPKNPILAALLSVLPYAGNEIANLGEASERDREDQTMRQEFSSGTKALKLAYSALRFYRQELSQDSDVWCLAARCHDREGAIQLCADIEGLTKQQATVLVNHYIAEACITAR